MRVPIIRIAFSIGGSDTSERTVMIWPARADERARRVGRRQRRRRQPAIGSTDSSARFTSR